MSKEAPQEGLPLPALPPGDSAEWAILAHVAAAMRDSQDADTIRVAIYVGTAAIKAHRARRGQTG